MLSINSESHLFSTLHVLTSDNLSTLQANFRQPLHEYTSATQSAPALRGDYSRHRKDPPEPLDSKLIPTGNR